MLVQLESLPAFVCSLPDYAQPKTGAGAEAIVEKIAHFLVDNGYKVVAAGVVAEGETAPYALVYVVCDHAVHEWAQMGRMLSHLVPTQPPPDFSVSEANSSSDPFVPLP
jgi:hypothetical protein